jgi:hypothetical protein
MDNVVLLFAAVPESGPISAVSQDIAAIMAAAERLQSAMEFLARAFDLVDRLVEWSGDVEQRTKMVGVFRSQEEALSCALQNLNQKIKRACGVDTALGFVRSPSFPKEIPL